EAIGPDCEKKIVGVRPGEKIHEDMITVSDAYYTFDLGKYYAIIPPVPNWNIEEFKKKLGAVPVAQGFSYNSGNNEEWESVKSIRSLIKEHLDPEFHV